MNSAHRCLQTRLLLQRQWWTSLCLQTIACHQGLGALRRPGLFPPGGSSAGSCLRLPSCIAGRQEERSQAVLCFERAPGDCLTEKAAADGGTQESLHPHWQVHLHLPHLLTWPRDPYEAIGLFQGPPAPLLHFVWLSDVSSSCPQAVEMGPSCSFGFGGKEMC